MADYKRTLLTFACSLLLLTQALLALNRYLKHEYKTRMEIVPLHKAHFLSFTVCPSYGAAYKREVLEKYGTTASRYRKGDFFTPNANKSHKEVFQDVTFGLHEMVASVTIQRSFDEVTIAPSSNQSGWLWTELSYVALGRCFSLQLEEEFVASGINTIAFKTNIDVLIYLHHPGQFYAPNSRSRIALNKGNRVYVDVTFDIISQNPYSKQENNCNPKMDLEFDQCCSDWYDERFMDQFGCLPPFTPTSSAVVCPAGQNETLAKRMKTFLLDQSMIRIPPKCGHSCSFSNALIGFPIMEENISNLTYGKTYLHSTVKRTYMTEDYPLMTMIGEIGGYTGLLLGVSLLDVYEIIRTLYTKTYKK